MGYLKMDEKHHEAITSLVAPSTLALRLLDPYADEGELLNVAAQAWNVTPYANELDGARTVPYILKNTVAAERREKVIEAQIAAGVNVVICNPELVKTGLDLVRRARA